MSSKAISRGILCVKKAIASYIGKLRDAAHEGRETRKAQPPLRQAAQVAEYEVREEPDPDLPLHGVLAVPDEVVNLASLLELLEERLDSPSVALDLRDGAGRPLEVVREEHHRLHLPLYLDHCRDATEDFLVLAGRGLFSATPIDVQSVSFAYAMSQMELSGSVFDTCQ